MGNWKRILTLEDTSSIIVSHTTFNSFSSSYSESVENFNVFSSSISESFTTINITASGNISGSTNVITQNISASNISASTITASNLFISGNVGMVGNLSFNGLNFIDSTVSVVSGSTIAGSGSTGSDVQFVNHQFTGSVFITGSSLTLNDGVLNIPGHSDVSRSLSLITASIDAFQLFSSSFSQSVIDFQTFSSSFSQSVTDFQTFSSSITESFTTNHITASGNISASGFLFISASETSNTSFNILVQDPSTGKIHTTGSIGGGGGGGNGTEIVLGADTTGNLLLNAGTTVQSSIDQINSVLDLLAPTVPPNLSAVSLDFFGTFNYSAIDKDGNTVSSITNDISPSFLSSEVFFNGDNGVLRAQHFPSSSGAVGTGYNSGFSVFDINLDTDDNTGINSILQIVSDTDPYAGQAGSSGFYKVLSAKINLTGLTPNNVDDYQRNTVRLIHTQTGVNGIDKEFTLDSDPVSSVTNLEFSYDESINEFHYQSGIKYLGNTNDITASYKVTIDSNANFINTSGRIAQISDSPGVFSSPYKTVSSFTPGQLYNVTHSLDVNDSEFQKGNVTLFGRNFKASSINFATNQTNTIISNLLIDSKQEDETKPNNGASLPLRVKSGEDQYPSFGTSTGNFGGTFDSTANISLSGYELQFANEYFHWPSSTNYTSYTPSGPNYTGISGDSSNNNLRYITFNLGTISDSLGFTLNINGAFGFDSSKIQTSDNFQLLIKIIDGSEDVTQWMNANAAYDTGVGDATNLNGKACLDAGGITGTNGNLTRIITFGSASPKSGTVYVRVGWNVNGGTSATSTSTRKFKYITKS